MYRSRRDDDEQKDFTGDGYPDDVWKVSFAENMETDPLETILSGMTLRELPAEGSSWSANLPAGLLACFGAGPAEGACPVKLPERDDQYMPKAEMPLE